MRQQLEVIARALNERDRLEQQQAESGARPGRQAQKKLKDVQSALLKLQQEPRKPDDAQAVMSELSEQAAALEARVLEKSYPERCVGSC